MGAKASTIWYVDSPDPIQLLRRVESSDWDAAAVLVKKLFPDKTAVPTRQASIGDSAGVAENEVFVGCYSGITVVCNAELAVAAPSTLPESWTGPTSPERTYLLTTNPANAWGAFAYWERGSLRRSFSASPIYIYEDIGLPLVWERPFWAGDRPLIYPPGVMPDPQSLPFHPQEFAETANAEWLGFRYTGAPRGSEFDPSTLPVCGFTLHIPGQEPVPAAVPTAPATPEPSVKRWFRRRAPEPRS